jgi:hypothetical protein
MSRIVVIGGVAAGMSAARMTIGALGQLDLAYAPPLAPVYDPILVAADVAAEELARRPA